MLSAKQLLVALLSLTSTASAAAILPRQSSAGTFTLNDFFIGATSAQSTPHSATYSFHISDLSATPSNFSTSCRAFTASGPGLASVPSTLCDDPSVSFAFANNGTGYLLSLQHLWGEDVQHAIVKAHDDFTDSAVVFWGSGELVDGQTVEGAPFEARLDAPTAFSVEYSRYA